MKNETKVILVNMYTLKRKEDTTLTLERRATEAWICEQKIELAGVSIYFSSKIFYINISLTS